MGTFSKGMRQRVKVAQALVAHPQVVVLDEPLTGLDPRQRLHLITIFQRLGAEGRCVIVSSHVLDEVERFGSRVLVMAQGRLAAEGDYHAIRDLMDDRPHRIRIRSDDPRSLAAGLLGGAGVVGVTLEGDDATIIDTRDAPSLRRSVAVVAREPRHPPHEVTPLDDDLESVFRYLVEPWPPRRPAPVHRRDPVRRSTGSCCARRSPGPGCAGSSPSASSASSSGPRWGQGEPAPRSSTVSAWSTASSMAGTRFVNTFGLSLLVPVTALVFAAASLGDPDEDGTLVYLWLRPIRRSRIVGAAAWRSFTVAGPSSSSPSPSPRPPPAAGPGWSSAPSPRPPSASSPTPALFCALGLVTKRSLVWGLLYIFIWEGFVATAADSAARLAVRTYARSVLSGIAEFPLRGTVVDSPARWVIPLAVGAVALAFATWRFARRDVD